MSSERRALLVLAAVLGLWVLFWSGDAIWGASTWFFHDLRHHHYPWRIWAGRVWNEGDLPLWAPVAHGYPMMADGQSGVLYPPNILLFRLLPEMLAYNWSIVLHHLLAAWGGLWLARVQGRSVPASALAGIAYGFSGFLISHLVYLGMFQVIALFPWMVGAAIKAVREGKAWWGMAGLLVGLGWLAGHPQMALYASYGVAYVALWEAIERRERSAWLGLPLLVTVAVLVALPQLYASFELTRMGLREGGVDAAFASMGGLPFEELVHGVLPYMFGFERPADLAITYHHRGGLYAGRGVSYFEDTFYLGIPAVVMAATAGRSRRARIWWVLAAIGVIGMLGAATPLFPALRVLPGMGWFRFPVRTVVWTVLAVSQLAAIGVDRMGGWLHAVPERAAHRARVLVAVAALFLVGTGGAHVALTQGDEVVHAALSARLVRPDGPDARGPEEAAQRARQVLDELSWSTAPWSPRVLWPITLVLGCAGIWGMAASGRLGPGAPARLLPTLLALDLALFGAEFNPRTPAEAVQTRPQVALELLGEPGPFRTTVLDRRVPADLDPALMSANLGLLWGAEDVIIPSPLRTVRNEQWLEAVGLDLGLVEGSEQVRRFVRNRVLADISGIRYLATLHELQLPDLALVREHSAGDRAGAVRIYENRRAFPRAWLAGCTVAPSAGERALDAVLGLQDPAGTAVVEGEGLSTCAPGVAGTVDLQRIGQGAYVLKVNAERPAWLVVTESFYPGMIFETATGSRDPVRTHDLFMGVPVEAGEQVIVLTYRPWPIYGAMAVSMLMMAAIALWFIRRPDES